MSGVNIEYKGESIATIPDTGSKTIKTQGKYCEGDILVEYEAPPTPTPDNTDALIDRSIVSLNSNVLSVGPYAFAFCDSLEEVSLPLATTIGAPKGGESGYAFYFCKNLVRVSFDNATRLAYHGFEYCTKLNITNLPLGITVVEKNTFNGCESLSNPTFLHDGVTRINDFAFKGCTGFHSFKMPKKINHIRTSAFANCTNMEYFDFSNVESVPTLINANAFDNTNGCPLYFKDQTQLDEFAAATNWSSLASRFQIKPSGV